MIEKINYIAEDGILIEYQKNSLNKQITFDMVSTIWEYLDENSFEGGKAYIWEDYIAFSAVVASGQGGVFFVWDSYTECFVHYSSCDYFSDAIMVNKDILLLCEVTNYVTPYHLEVYSITFGITDLNEIGQRLYCENPEKYITASPMGAKFRLTGDVLEIVDDNCGHVFSSDISHIKGQTPNPQYIDLYKDYGTGMNSDKLILQSMIT